MKTAHRLIAMQAAQRTCERHMALQRSALTRLSTQSRPWWHRLGAGLLAGLLWFSPIAITAQRASLDAQTLGAGARFFPFWTHLLPLDVHIGLAEVNAAPIVDPNAPIQFQPKLTQSTGSSGGVPVVNITAPNAAGLSLNQYQSFNVDVTGLILNNSLFSGTSLTGGTVQANPNLSGRTASVIINQVTSDGTSFASALNGPLEVFGTPATVVIVNPNGISTRGTSFTNTIGVTLSTGTPQFLTGVNGAATSFANGSAIAYDVTGGHIQIEGNPTSSGPAAGIEGTVGNVDLIAETIGVNAPLYVGNTINLIAGRQLVTPTASSNTGTTYGTSANGSSNTAAAINAANANLNGGYAIDATAFGAVTAGQIQVIGTPSGMGVRIDSQLAANAGDINLSASGDLSVAGTNAQQQLSMQTAGRPRYLREWHSRIQRPLHAHSRQRHSAHGIRRYCFRV
jgi:filamentous hemagglutinin